MATINIVKDPDTVLRKKCRKVEKIDGRILTLLDDMKETLIQANGVGLAAPQVGVLRRVVLVVDGEEFIELINPEIIAYEGTQNAIEGCLSCPHKWGITERPQTVTVRALNRSGESFIRTGSDLLARAFCHEIDHLDGILFKDKVIEWVDEKDLE